MVLDLVNTHTGHSRQGVDRPPEHSEGIGVVSTARKACQERAGGEGFKEQCGN